MNFKSLCLATVIALSSIISPTQATNANPTGSWQSVGGESRFHVSLCGDGSQLCAKLTWLRADARTPENVAHLNNWVINGATQTADNKWSGALTYDGVTVKGSVTMVNANRLKVNGCRLVVCQTIELVRQ